MCNRAAIYGLLSSTFSGCLCHRDTTTCIFNLVVLHGASIWGHARHDSLTA